MKDYIAFNVLMKKDIRLKRYQYQIRQAVFLKHFKEEYII